MCQGVRSLGTRPEARSDPPLSFRPEARSAEVEKSLVVANETLRSRFLDFAHLRSLRSK